MESFRVIYMIGIAFLVILAILWFFLPFAIFGTQPKIDKLIAEAVQTNKLLVEIKKELAKRDDKFNLTLERLTEIRDILKILTKPETP